MVIARLDHLSLTVPDARAAAADYAVLLGQAPQPLQDGSIRLQCENVAFVLTEARVQKSPAYEVPMQLVFAAEDLDAAQHRLVRRGLPGDRHGARLDLDTKATHGLGISVVQDDASRRAGARESDILGLDHVVIHTRDADRAVGFFGGRLGLDLRLDRVRPEIGVQQLFFVIGGLVLEVVRSLKDTGDATKDGVWGLAWRSKDIAATRARLLAAGVAVTEIRDGRKPGTQVATVKSHISSVPTLLIGGEGLERS